MGYDLNGEKYIFTINVEKYDESTDRLGSELDEENLVKTFQVLVWLTCNIIILNCWFFKFVNLKVNHSCRNSMDLKSLKD